VTGYPRAGSMLPWMTAIVLLGFPIAVADFDYRYLLPVLPFACLAAGLAFAPARTAAQESHGAGHRFGHMLRHGGPRRILSVGESAGRSRRAQAR